MPPCIIVILFVFESHVVYCVNLRKEIKLKLKKLEIPVDRRRMRGGVFIDLEQSWSVVKDRVGLQRF